MVARANTAAAFFMMVPVYRELTWVKTEEQVSSALQQNR
jgi:hypothetical protein